MELVGMRASMGRRRRRRQVTGQGRETWTLGNERGRLVALPDQIQELFYGSNYQTDPRTAAPRQKSRKLR
jgi:hypothetical protein